MKKQYDRALTAEELAAMPDEDINTDDIPELVYNLKLGEVNIAVANLLYNTGLVATTSAAIRLIKQGGLKINNVKISDTKLLIAAGSNDLYQLGKRTFATIHLLKS